MKHPKIETQPTERQVKLLCKMMYFAFIEIRFLASKGESQQIGALANAFHNLPSVVMSGHFKWDWFEDSLKEYHRQYESLFPYIDMLKSIEKGEPNQLLDPL
jgi:hypothetical protein